MGGFGYTWGNGTPWDHSVLCGYTRFNPETPPRGLGVHGLYNTGYSNPQGQWLLELRGPSGLLFYAYGLGNFPALSLNTTPLTQWPIVDALNPLKAPYVLEFLLSMWVPPYGWIPVDNCDFILDPTITPDASALGQDRLAPVGVPPGTIPPLPNPSLGSLPGELLDVVVGVVRQAAPLASPCGLPGFLPGTGDSQLGIQLVNEWGRLVSPIARGSADVADNVCLIWYDRAYTPFIRAPPDALGSSLTIGGQWGPVNQGGNCAVFCQAAFDQVDAAGAYFDGREVDPSTGLSRCVIDFRDPKYASQGGKPFFLTVSTSQGRRNFGAFIPSPVAALCLTLPTGLQRCLGRDVACAFPLT